MTKALAKSNKKGYPALTGNRDAKNKNGSSKHDWRKQYGENKEFTDKNSFMTWLHKAPTNGKSTAKKNGLLWFWCSKCLRYTGHKSAECTKPTKRDNTVAFAGIAAADSDVDSDGSMVSAVAWTESEDESSPVRKKSRTKRTKKTKIVVESSDEESVSDE